MKLFTYSLIVIVVGFSLGCSSDSDVETNDIQPEQQSTIVEQPQIQVVEFENLMSGNNIKQYENQQVSFEGYIIHRYSKTCIEVAGKSDLFAIPSLSICDENTHFLNLAGIGSKYTFVVKVIFSQEEAAWVGIIQNRPTLIPK